MSKSPKKRIAVQVLLRQEDAEALRKEASKNDLSSSAYVRILIIKDIKNQQK